MSTGGPIPWRGPIPEGFRKAVEAAIRRLELRRRLEGAATFGAFAGGLSLAGYGVSLVSLPAALIAGGLVLAALAVLFERGR